MSLAAFSEFTSTPEFSSYRDDFIEKYGVYREVPILELIDIDRGIEPLQDMNFQEVIKRLIHTFQLLLPIWKNFYKVKL